MPAQHITLTPHTYSNSTPLTEAEKLRLSEYASRWLDRVVLQWLRASDEERRQLEELTSIIHEVFPR